MEKKEKKKVDKDGNEAKMMEEIKSRMKTSKLVYSRRKRSADILFRLQILILRWRNRKSRRIFPCW